MSLFNIQIALPAVLSIMTERLRSEGLMLRLLVAILFTTFALVSSRASTALAQAGSSHRHRDLMISSPGTYIEEMPVSGRPIPGVSARVPPLVGGRAGIDTSQRLEVMPRFSPGASPNTRSASDPQRDAGPNAGSAERPSENIRLVAPPKIAR